MLTEKEVIRAKIDLCENEVAKFINENRENISLEQFIEFERYKDFLRRMATTYYNVDAEKTRLVKMFYDMEKESDLFIVVYNGAPGEYPQSKEVDFMKVGDEFEVAEVSDILKLPERILMHYTLNGWQYAFFNWFCFDFKYKDKAFSHIERLYRAYMNKDHMKKGGFSDDETLKVNIEKMKLLFGKSLLT